MGKRVLVVYLPLLALVALAGCAKHDDGRGVATANSAAAPAATTSVNQLEQGRRHAQCMRDHGVPEQDPQARADGSVRVGDGYDKHTLDQDLLSKAIEACRSYERVLSPDDLANKLAGARQFAQCMRAHGVESYPDPDPADLGRSVPDAVRDDPDFDAAKQACQRPASAPATDRQ